MVRRYYSYADWLFFYSCGGNAACKSSTLVNFCHLFWHAWKLFSCTQQIPMGNLFIIINERLHFDSPFLWILDKLLAVLRNWCLKINSEWYQVEYKNFHPRVVQYFRGKYVKYSKSILNREKPGISVLSCRVQENQFPSHTGTKTCARNVIDFLMTLIVLCSEFFKRFC